MWRDHAALTLAAPKLGSDLGLLNTAANPKIGKSKKVKIDFSVGLHSEAGVGTVGSLKKQGDGGQAPPQVEQWQSQPQHPSIVPCSASQSACGFSTTAKGALTFLRTASVIL